MKAMDVRLGIVVAGFLLTAGPVLAQKPEPGAGSGGGDRAAARDSGGGGTTANAGGGGGGGNIASSGGGGSASSSSSGGGFSPSASSVMSPSISMGDRSVRMSAPEHRMNYSDSSGPRSHTATSGSGQSDKATPRTSSGGSSASGSSASGSSGSGSSNSGARSAGSGSGTRPAGNSEARSNGPASERAANRGPWSPRDTASPNAAANRRADTGTASNNASGTSEVPSWSRPRGDRPVTDTAVTRVGPRPDRDPDHNHGHSGYADPYYYGGFGYSFGLGFYDQNYYGYPFYSPFGFGYGIPSGYFDPFYSDPYDYGAGYGAYSSSVYGGHDSGSLKLKVKPHNAKVYVDGYFAGTVDQFDGAFQKLALNGGRHKVELQAEGYETTEFDVLISPQQTVSFAGNMKKNQ